MYIWASFIEKSSIEIEIASDSMIRNYKLSFETLPPSFKIDKKK